MTASRRRIDPGTLNQFTMAGQRLGLDLSGLFEEDEEGNTTTPDGFLPMFTTSMTAPTRQGRLSYMPQARANSTTSFSLMPEQGSDRPGDINIENNNTNTNTFNPVNNAMDPSNPQPGDPTQPIEPEDPAYFSELTDIASRFGQTGLFGGQDYVKAKEAGYTDEQIKTYFDARPEMLHEENKIGNINGLYDQLGRGAVDTSLATTRDWAVRNSNYEPQERGDQAFRDGRAYENAPKIQTRYGQNDYYFGGEDLKAARESGYSDDSIKEFLNQNLDRLRGENVAG